MSEAPDEEQPSCFCLGVVIVNKKEHATALVKVNESARLGFWRVLSGSNR